MMRASSSSSEGSASRNTRSAGMLKVMSRVSGHEVAERELKFGIVSTKYADEQRIHIQT